MITQTIQGYSNTIAELVMRNIIDSQRQSPMQAQRRSLKNDGSIYPMVKPETFSLSNPLGQNIVHATGYRQPIATTLQKRKEKRAIEQKIESKIKEVMNSEEFLDKITEHVQSRCQELVSAINISHNDDSTPATEMDIYESQLLRAQEFINRNKKADVSRLRDFLRMIMPAAMHSRIDNIQEGQDPHTLINIQGGQNQILTNADKAVQVSRDIK